MQLRNSSCAAFITLMLTGSALACDGTVTIGEGPAQIKSTVPNKFVGNACLNDLIIDTTAEGANYGNHGAFVKSVAVLTHAWVENRIITRKQAVELIATSARSAVGKTMRLRVIAFNDFHGNLDGANLNFASAADNIPARTPAGGVDSASGDTLFPAYGVKNFKGNHIAFIGMTLQGTPSIVTPSGVLGLEFRSEADTANALIIKLKKQHVESVSADDQY